MNDLLLEANSNMIASLQEEVAHKKIELSHGQISGHEFNKALMILQKKIIETQRLQQTYDQHIIQLKYLLGIDFSSTFSVDPNIRFQDSVMEPITALHTAKAYNPDIQISWLNLQKMELKFSLDKNKRKADLSLEASINNEGKKQAGISLSLIIPNAHTVYESTQKNLQYLYAKEDYSRSDFKLRKSIHDQLEQLTHLKLMVELSASELTLQESIYQSESTKFRFNQASGYAFQQAVSDLNQAFHNSLKTQVDYANAQDTLSLLLGVLHPSYKEDISHE